MSDNGHENAIDRPPQTVREAFPVASGQVTVYWTPGMTPVDFEHVSDWLEVVMFKMKSDVDRQHRSETTASISRWANATFGEAVSNARVAARANEEMSELLRAITADDESPKAREEIADIVIVLARLSHRLGGDIWKDVEAKMQVNRRREWKKDGTGHGYHVRPGSEAEARAAK